MIGWNYGLWFSGFQRLTLSGVTVRNANNFYKALGNGSNFIIEQCQSRWDDNDGVTQTNFNRDGIHMFGNLDSGHIVDYYTNGDDDALAFNTDEGSQLGDSRRGTGYAISNIIAENIQLDAASQAFRFWGSNGTGTLSNITIRNVYGVMKQGAQQYGCSPPTVAGRTYLGRTNTDSGLVSVNQITIDGWNPTVINGASAALAFSGVSNLQLVNISAATSVTVSGVEDYTGDRAPAWQRIPPRAIDKPSSAAAAPTMAQAWRATVTPCSGAAPTRATMRRLSSTA